MKKIIRLTESDLHRVILNSVSDILAERHVLKLPNANPMGGDDMPPMDAPMPNEDPMGDMPPMDDNMGSGDENMDMGGGNESDNPKVQNIQNMISQMPDEDLKAAEGYIESLLDDNGNSNSDNQEQGGDSMNMPMESRRYLKKTINEVLTDILTDRVNKSDRTEKEITNTKISRRNPFVANR